MSIVLSRICIFNQLAAVIFLSKYINFVDKYHMKTAIINRGIDVYKYMYSKLIKSNGCLPNHNLTFDRSIDPMYSACKFNDIELARFALKHDPYTLYRFGSALECLYKKACELDTVDIIELLDSVKYKYEDKELYAINNNVRSKAYTFAVENKLVNIMHYLQEKFNINK
ncbi:MAG: hypothetical protein EOP34_05030, partial [Rickettsiales bacterium]